ncbi:AN1-type zinc finger protein 1-like [Pollicipes pollicipes]|uniref:AN1-type zinc finger protein 1-like n=1 Tax=Pollicipes pollicipes TaxID=41117 RepID=UPI0018856F45|nr:AN1-type zinc finger protein 1-like [Pollicipes pollicipes]
MAELPELGRHCGLAACRQLDFLPLVCAHCQVTFCRHHVAADVHSCDKAPQPAEADLTASTRVYGCHVAGCTAAELTPVTCPGCQRPCCLTHRHEAEHDCPPCAAMDTPVEQLAAGQLDSGETVVLEYGDPAQPRRDDVTRYDVT